MFIVFDKRLLVETIVPVCNVVLTVIVVYVMVVTVWYFLVGRRKYRFVCRLTEGKVGFFRR